jgi:hypothetical protein
MTGWLTSHGYPHPELRRCVLELGASGDQKVVDSFAADGFLIDQGQAVADARQILAEPHITAALDILAELLLAERELDGARIEDVLRSHHPDRHPTPPAWIPGRRLPNVAAHRDSAASPITGRTPSSVHQAADKPSRSTSLSRLTALEERISAESQQRAASRPPADSAGESKEERAPHPQSEHELSLQQHAPNDGHIR